ncbi:FAD binding domain-containing protein [Apiospora arundinis]
MLLRTLCLAALTVIGVESQAFEPADFNVTQALVERGVNFSALPELASLADRSSTHACQCDSLDILYGSHAIEFENKMGYSLFTKKYWSGIVGEVKPYCIFWPPTPDSLSVMVLISRRSQCPFAVKSGGHSAFAGGASIEGGITVSLEKLRGITLAADKQTVAVQPGNTWGPVLAALNTTGVTVLAGRISDLGVGGLTLGGWHIVSHQSVRVVTASGRIINASPTQYPDLYWSLRGGGNNFGIVTTFHLQTKPLPGDLMFGGTRTFPEAPFPQVIKAYVDLTLHSAQDPKAGSWIAWIKKDGAKLASTELWYGAPLAKGADAPILSAFYQIDAVSDTTMTRGHANYVLDHGAGAFETYGRREVFYVATVKASHEIAARAVDIFYDAIRDGTEIAAVKGIFPVLVWQHITDGALKGSARNGGEPNGV